MGIDGLGAPPGLLGGLPEQALAGAPGGAFVADAGLMAPLGGPVDGTQAGAIAGPLTADAVMPALGLDGPALSGDAGAPAAAGHAAGGSPADELAAGGQLRGLTEMARDLARGSHALRSAEDSAPATPRAGASPGEALVAANGAAAAEVAPVVPLTPGLLLALQPAAGEPARSTSPHDGDWRPARDRRREGDPREPGEEAEDEGGPEGEAARDDDAPPRRPGIDVVPPEEAWCLQLLAALQCCARREPVAQDALKAAADAWARGRSVLLACPSGEADALAGWLFVLRPRPGPGALRLGGERLAARLRWARVGTGQASRWWQVRVAKSYSLRRGGQLLTQDEGADGRVACELQLGPFPPALPRWRDVLVRVDAVSRLWQALGTQWSLPLLVCDRPLLAAASAGVPDPTRRPAA